MADKRPRRRRRAFEFAFAVGWHSGTGRRVPTSSMCVYFGWLLLYLDVHALGVLVGEVLDLLGLGHVEELGLDPDLLERVLELRDGPAVQL